MEENNNMPVTPKPTALIPKNKPLPVADDSAAFLAFDQRDEEQIVAELKGQLVDEFVYVFQQGGKEVVGLSWVAIQEFSRQFKKIETEVVREIETDDYVRIVVRAIDLETGTKRLGAKQQFKKKQTKYGIFDDPFFYEACLSKAQRNAIRQLLPQVAMREFIDNIRKKEKNKVVNLTINVANKFNGQVEAKKPKENIDDFPSENNEYNEFPEPETSPPIDLFNEPTEKQKENNMASSMQLKKIYAMTAKLKSTDWAKLYIKDNFAKISSKELTKKEASQLIEALIEREEKTNVHNS